MTVVAGVAVAVRVVVAAIEVEGTRVAAAASMERRRPIEAVGADIAEARGDATARSGEEDTVAIRAGNTIAVDIVDGSPGPGALRVQFAQLVYSWHTPRTAPISAGCVIREFKRTLIVDGAV